MVRAALEAIGYQTRDVLEAMTEDSGINLDVLRADGGATANSFLMRFQAGILGAAVDRPVVRETTALGAAYLAGLAVGYWRDTAEIAAQWKRDARFEPSMTADERDVLYAGWKRAVERALRWEEAGGS